MAMSLPDTQTMLTIIEVMAGLATFGALVFAGYTLIRVRLTEQVRLAEGIRRDLNALDRELMSNGDNMNIKLWDQSYFNQLDWLCLLIRKKEIKADFLKKYFAPSIVKDYEDIFLKHASQKDIEDPKTYENFKEVYEKLKDP